MSRVDRLCLAKVRCQNARSERFEVERKYAASRATRGYPPVHSKWESFLLEMSSKYTQMIGKFEKEIDELSFS